MKNLVFLVSLQEFYVFLQILGLSETENMFFWNKIRKTYCSISEMLQ